MPTGCRSEYLKSKSQRRVPPRGNRRQCEPTSNLERGAEDLGPHEFRHVGEVEAKSAAMNTKFFDPFGGESVEAPKATLKEERGTGGVRCGEGPFSVKSAENKDDDVRDQPGRFLSR